MGRIEYQQRYGALVTDFTLITPGALHRANGGYLVLDADKVLLQPFAWNALKRALHGEEIRIESIERLVGVMGTASLEPEPVPLRVKVALVGDRELYYLLKAYDPDFGPLFKVVADFSEDMPRQDDQEMAYAHLIATLQQREGLIGMAGQHARARVGVGQVGLCAPADRGRQVIRKGGVDAVDRPDHAVDVDGEAGDLAAAHRDVQTDDEREQLIKAGYFNDDAAALLLRAARKRLSNPRPEL